MSGTRARRWYVVLLVLGALATVLTIVRMATAPSYTSPKAAERVVIVGVPSLDWSLINPEVTPHLWAAAQEGGTGLITARAARSVTCPWDGWLTVGAGNRARYPATIPEDELPPEQEVPLPGEPTTTTAAPTTPLTPEEERQQEATRGCLEQRGAVPTVEGSKLTPAIAENDRLNFGAEPGALGSAVECSTVVGSAPILAVGAEGAQVTVADKPADVTGWAQLTAQCPLTLVATASAFEKTSQQLTDLDTAIGDIISGARESGAAVLIAGISQPDYRRATLHAVIAVDAGLDGQLLSSPTTSRAPYSQVIDLAPTALRMLGEDIPTSMNGRSLRGSDRDSTLTAQIEQFGEQSVAASAHVWMSSKFFTVLSWVGALGAIALYVLLLRERGSPRAMQVAGIAVSAVAPASFLANIVPWWTFGRPSVAIISALVVSWAVLVALAYAGPWRRSASGPAIALCGFTFAMLGIDVLTGSHLQLNSPLGYDAIVAGRFTGFGNIAFAIFGTTALVSIAAAARLAGGDRKRILAIVAVLGIALIAVDGSPTAGADFGGVVSMVPALLLMGMVLTGTKMTPVRLALIMGAGAVVVIAIALADYFRPPSEQTHLGRFIGQILDGTAWTIVERKLGANWNVLTGSVLTILCVVLLVIVVLLLRRRPPVGHEYAATYAPYVAAGVLGVLTVSILGFAVNDSGIAVTAASLVVVVPAALGVLAAWRAGSDAASESIQAPAAHKAP
ncbi:hypothetical protein EK0264_00540 [Epidermidibacterium keratini]|uniref:Uncharacterized protein n=1 Tax=Epidermidibacterium keratini TaxID=1891644 RepID=A0A7L4YI22_9ACTN|nr:hypothetical protein [Epidermidibacterium keratini]QHB98931.1 hypothetical protein EK0264_00540 [Epidermidibacterium keratini]